MGDAPGGKDDGGDAILGFNRRKALLTAGGAFGLIGQVADFGKLVHSAKQADKAWLPLAAAGEVLAYVGYVIAYRAIARVDGGPRLPVWTAIRVVALGFGAFVVGSSAGGLAVDFWALRRAGLPTHRAARRVLALNTFEWGVLAWFASAAAAVVLARRGGGAPLPMALGWIVVVPACTAAALLVSQPGRVDRLESLGGRVERPRSRRARAWARWLWSKALCGFADAVGGVEIVRLMVSRPRRHLAGLLGFPLFWCGDLLTLYAALRAFGGHVALAALVLAYATAYVVTALPLPAGGAGSMEAAIAATLTGVGGALALGLLAAFLYRVFSFWLPILPALALLPSVPRLNHDLPDALPAQR